MQREFLPISGVATVRHGTIADLKMRSGRVYRAVLGFRGRVCAWWPMSNQRKKPIGTCEPVSFAVIAVGNVAPSDWAEAQRQQHAGPRHPEHSEQLLARVGS